MVVLPNFEAEFPDFETPITSLIERTTGLQDIVTNKLEDLSSNFGINPGWLNCGSGSTSPSGLLGCLWDDLNIDVNPPTINTDGFSLDVGIQNLYNDIASLESDTAEIM